MKIRTLTVFMLFCFLSCKKQNETNNFPIEKANDFPYEDATLKMEVVSNSLPRLVERIHFFDATIGNCITLTGKIFKTIDGGKTWKEKYSSTFSDFTLSELIFLDDKIGFAVGGGRSCSGSGCQLPDGQILKTIDGGDTWITAKVSLNSEFLSITQDDSQNVYAINRAYDSISNGALDTKMTVYKSKDLGKNWDSLTSIGFYPFSISSNDKALHISGSKKILRVSDEGKLWKELNVSVKDFRFFYDIAFKNGVGYCLENQKNLWKTTDNGENWTKIFEDDNYTSRINVISDKKCILFGTGKILSDDGIFPVSFSAYKITEDGGLSWKKVEFNSFFFYANHFFDSKNGFVADRGGNLVKISLK
jgi:photosystem II stability/assembly factor-like uncharacterized protein